MALSCKDLEGSTCLKDKRSDCAGCFGYWKSTQRICSHVLKNGVLGAMVCGRHGRLTPGDLTCLRCYTVVLQAAAALPCWDSGSPTQNPRPRGLLTSEPVDSSPLPASGSVPLKGWAVIVNVNVMSRDWSVLTPLFKAYRMINLIELWLPHVTGVALTQFSS
jgi:hypothetical protein